MTCSINSIITICKIYIVQIELQYFFFTVTSFQFNRQKHLLNFVLPGVIRIQVHQFCQLHGNCTATLRNSSMSHSCFHCTHYGFKIYPVMPVKFFVLNTDNCSNEILWYVFVFDILRILCTFSLRYQLSIFVIHRTCL